MRPRTRRAIGRRLRVLFVDQYLADPNGAGLVLVDLARAFAARERFAMAAWSPVLGEVADRLRALGVRIAATLDDVPWMPDLIHAQHLAESRAAAARFPDVPMIRVCHGKTAAAALERLPSIRAWVGVSEFTCARIVRETGVDRVTRLPNFVDGEVFRYRDTVGDAAHGVLYSNHVRPDDPAVLWLRANLARHGVRLTVVGRAAGNLVSDPAAALTHFGFALAVGRSAIEAIALGLPTVLCDGVLVGEACFPDRLEEMSRHNFAFASGKLPSMPLDAEPAVAAILRARDSPRDVWCAAGAWVREHLEASAVAARWAALYREVLASAGGGRS